VGSPFAPIRRPEALSPNVAGLVYQNIDAQAFWPEFGMAVNTPPNAQRIYADATGSQPGAVNTRIWAPLPIPVGSIIFQISAAYQGQPIIEISKRTLFSTGGPGTPPTQAFQQSFPASPGGSFASTVTLPNPVVLAADSTYTVSAFCTAGASLFGVSVGYLPPTLSFYQFGGDDPRVLDTRVAGGKFNVGEQRKVFLGAAGATSGVFNLTVDQTEGNVAGSPPGGFLSAFAGDTFPGNSSVNWDHPGQISANLVIAGLDDLGNVTIRCNVNRAHVILDMIGYFV